ncbi:TetR family transcriptional regulator [Streptomyces sp. NBC_00111]|uniref:TetR family transcriptional regulator n=1 Tax=unclassified Streptomyces TaxID=2593676 RepID=UPI002E3372F5|nr:TetR family transcriptional regulator [Streptomyces sp. NBC_01460]
MVKQVRAERTRQALIAAAAVEFDRRGYAGTSLSAVHRACGMTMGALSFHFPTKAELARAVLQEAEDITRGALARFAPARPVPPVAEFTLALATLLDEEASVRATARLTHEQAVPSLWPTLWRTALQDLMAPARERPGPGPAPGELELLAVYLTAGAEAALRAGRTGEEVRAQLACLWSLALGPSPDPAPEALAPSTDECPVDAAPTPH